MSLNNTHTTPRSVQDGFTIIELMLSMTFVAVLLIAITAITIQVGSIYNKGVTLQEVNQAGRSLSTDFQRTIAQSIPFDASTTDHFREQSGNGGRLCTGRVSYLWNYGKGLADNTPINRYDDGTPITFARVSDPGGTLCINLGLVAARADSTELLDQGDHNLAVHELSISSPSVASVSQQMYSIRFILGTNDAAQLETNNQSCRPPSEGAGNEDYCAVNQFEIVARAGNQSGGEEQ